MSKLKTCPFCEREPDSWVNFNSGQNNYIAVVQCPSSVHEVQAMAIDKDKEKAVKSAARKWNNRNKVGVRKDV